MKHHQGFLKCLLWVLYYGVMSLFEVYIKKKKKEPNHSASQPEGGNSPKPTAADWQRRFFCPRSICKNSAKPDIWEVEARKT